jgi:hypothetical protein
MLAFESVTATSVPTPHPGSALFRTRHCTQVAFKDVALEALLFAFDAISAVDRAKLSGICRITLKSPTLAPTGLYSTV